MKVLNFQSSVFRIYIILAIGLICFHSCKPEDAPQNPCTSSHKVSASFLIQEDWNSNDYGSGQWEYYDSDTLSTVRVKFTANEDGATYRWQIGTDTNVFTQKSFSLSFNDYLAAHPGYRRFDVRLIVNRTPDTRCFPDDDGIDTIIRTFTIVDSLRVRTLIKGHFFGTWDGNSSDTTTIYITQGNLNAMYAYNLSPKFNTITHGYGDYTYENTALGYREVICHVNGGAFDYNTIKLNKDNTVTIVGYDFLNNRIKHFTGIKISDK